METFTIPTENDFKKWIREAVTECLQKGVAKPEALQVDEGFLDRKETARLLKISLVTLNDWVKRGLPCHKQRGRVYFVRAEVLRYIQEKDVQMSKHG